MITWKWGRETTGHKNLRIYYGGHELVAVWEKKWPHGHNWSFGAEWYEVKGVMFEARKRLGEKLAKEFAGVDR